MQWSNQEFVGFNSRDGAAFNSVQILKKMPIFFNIVQKSFKTSCHLVFLNFFFFFLDCRFYLVFSPLPSVFFNFFFLKTSKPQNLINTYFHSISLIQHGLRPLKKGDSSNVRISSQIWLTKIQHAPSKPILQKHLLDLQVFLMQNLHKLDIFKPTKREKEDEKNNDLAKNNLDEKNNSSESHKCAHK